MLQEIVVDWNNYMLEVCCWKVKQNAIIIGELGLTVKIDESMFTCQKNWIFGGISHEIKEYFLVCLPKETATTLMLII